MRPCPGRRNTSDARGRKLAQLMTENQSLRQRIIRLEAELARVRKVCQDNHIIRGRPRVTPHINGATRSSTT